MIRRFIASEPISVAIEAECGARDAPRDPADNCSKVGMTRNIGIQIVESQHHVVEFSIAVPAQAAA